MVRGEPCQQGNSEVARFLARSDLDWAALSTHAARVEAVPACEIAIASAGALLGARMPHQFVPGSAAQRWVTRSLARRQLLWHVGRHAEVARGHAVVVRTEPLPGRAPGDEARSNFAEGLGSAVRPASASGGSWHRHRAPSTGLGRHRPVAELRRHGSATCATSPRSHRWIGWVSPRRDAARLDMNQPCYSFRPNVFTPERTYRIGADALYLDIRRQREPRRL